MKYEDSWYYKNRIDYAKGPGGPGRLPAKYGGIEYADGKYGLYTRVLANQFAFSAYDFDSPKYIPLELLFSQRTIENIIERSREATNMRVYCDAIDGLFHGYCISFCHNDYRIIGTLDSYEEGLVRSFYNRYKNISLHSSASTGEAFLVREGNNSLSWVAAAATCENYNSRHALHSHGRFMMGCDPIDLIPKSKRFQVNIQEDVLITGSTNRALISRRRI